MKIIWDDKAWEEYVEWQTMDRKIVKKINEITF
ncbi:type II toxin-antitoxin system YoeB family toxin [Fusobacterium vincentii]